MLYLVNAVSRRGYRGAAYHFYQVKFWLEPFIENVSIANLTIRFKNGIEVKYIAEPKKAQGINQGWILESDIPYLAVYGKEKDEVIPTKGGIQTMKEIRAFCDICGREISPGIMNNKRMDLGYENKRQTNFKLEDVCNSCQCKIINYITELMKEGK